jgi:hypothetical protein
MAVPALATGGHVDSPSLRIVTSVAAQNSPVVIANTDGWTSEGGIWTATVRSASPAAGATQIDSTWTSPVFRARPRQTYFAFDVQIAHQGAPTRVNAFLQQVRICYVGQRCSRWEGVGADDLPDQYTAAVPFQVTAGIGQTLGTLNDSFRAYAQFRFHQTQRGLDEQTMTMRVAVGAAAARLAGHVTA